MLETDEMNQTRKGMEGAPACPTLHVFAFEARRAGRSDEDGIQRLPDDAGLLNEHYRLIRSFRADGNFFPPGVRFTPGYASSMLRGCKKREAAFLR
jgi:hypothetical protein